MEKAIIVDKGIDKPMPKGLGKSFFNRDSNIKAKVVADSISSISGDRITTLEVEYPRFIHSEVMTHRMLSKNCSSSRAIPVDKIMEQIEENMALPIYFGKKKGGMQADEEIDFPDLAKKFWVSCGRGAIADSKVMDTDFFLHKQISNRITEPYQMIKVLITGTEWDNFFNLRIHPTAQPEIAMLAYKIYVAMQESKPKKLESGDWHLPYIDVVNIDGKLQYFSRNDGEIQRIDLETAIKVSASCSAQTSYRKSDQSISKAERVFDLLIHSDVIHASPFEHVATPISATKVIENSVFETISLNLPSDVKSWEKGITHTDKNGDFWCGNLKGWNSYRHSRLSNNNCNNFEFEKRMKQFH